MRFFASEVSLYRCPYINFAYVSINGSVASTDFASPFTDGMFRLDKSLGWTPRCNTLDSVATWASDAFYDSSIDRLRVGWLVRSHEERNCSNLGPTQGHLSPSIL